MHCESMHVAESTMFTYATTRWQFLYFITLAFKRFRDIINNQHRPASPTPVLYKLVGPMLCEVRFWLNSL